MGEADGDEVVAEVVAEGVAEGVLEGEWVAGAEVP